MPNTDDAVIDKLSDNIAHIDSVTTMLEMGLTPEQMHEMVLDGFDIEFTDKKDVEFKCDCSREKFLAKIKTLSQQDKKDLAAPGEPIEVVCRFCGKKYTYTPEEIV